MRCKITILRIWAFNKVRPALASPIHKTTKLTIVPIETMIIILIKVNVQVISAIAIKIIGFAKR
jgi:hypothetical protein